MPKCKCDREKLHAFVEKMCDLIGGTTIPDDVLDLDGADLDTERLWRTAGLATMVGLGVYEDAEKFVTSVEVEPAPHRRAVVSARYSVKQYRRDGSTHYDSPDGKQAAWRAFGQRVKEATREGYNTARVELRRHTDQQVEVLNRQEAPWRSI